MALSTFAVTNDPPQIVLCILFAVPGLIGWAVPYVLYKKLVQKRTKVVASLMEGKYEEIYELCQKGSHLL